ncbi:unnamed protein product [Rhizopus stolonifer]
MFGLTLTTKQPVWSHVIFWIWVSCSLSTLIFMLDSAVSKKLYTSLWQRKDVHSCEMTYIYPNYQPIIPQPNSKFSKKYKLYLYREGYYDSEHLVGLPALFIPGQAGSYKQVRSIASETSKYSFSKKASVSMQDIDWFTLDINEELTAFSGQQLLDQATYTNTAIQAILSLYEGKVDSVILVGHSMGGIVARTVLMQPNYVSDSVRTIFTLATPHQNAPILLDPVLNRVYRNLSAYWQLDQFETGALQEVTLISVAGGSLDTIVHSDSTGLEGIVPKSHGFATFTTSIPSVWTGSDHMAILWCNQFVKRIARTLVDLCHSSQHVQERMFLMKQSLLDSSIFQNTFKQLEIPKNIQILNISTRGYHLPEAMTQPRLTLIPSEQFAFLTNLEEKYDSQWQLVACEKKWDCRPLVPTITLTPNEGGTFRLISVVDSTASYIGLLEHTVPTRPFIIIHPPSIQRYLWSTWDILWTKSFTASGYYSRHVFPHIRHSLFAYDLYVVKTALKPVLFEPMMRQTIHGKEAKYYRDLKKGVSDRITFHQTPGEEGLVLSFYTDNQDMELLISLDWYATLGRCALRYGDTLIQYWYMCTLLILSSMSFTFVMIGKTKFVSYKEAMVSCMKTVFIQVILFLLLTSLGQYYITTHPWIVKSSFLQKMFSGNDEPMLIPIASILFMLAVGFTAIAWITITSAVALLSVPFRFFHSSFTLPRFCQCILHLTIVLVSLYFIPISVIFVSYYILWLLMTASSRFSATDLPHSRNTYRYRQSWLLFLTSLLPYHVPNVIVYVKDLLIGWTEHEISIELIICQLPYILLLVYLVTFGKNANLYSR